MTCGEPKQSLASLYATARPALWTDDAPRTLGVIGRQYERDAFTPDYYRDDGVPATAEETRFIVGVLVVCTIVFALFLWAVWRWATGQAVWR